MIKRDSWGHSYFVVRGEILGFTKDELLRKHLPRMFSLIYIYIYIYIYQNKGQKNNVHLSLKTSQSPVIGISILNNRML